MTGTTYLVSSGTGGLEQRFPSRAKAISYAKSLSKSGVRVGVYLDNPHTGFHLFIARFSHGKAERGARALVR